jgi:hypothetical protein
LNDGTATLDATVTDPGGVYLRTVCRLGPQHMIVYDATVTPVWTETLDGFASTVVVTGVPYRYGGQLNQYAANCVSSLTIDNHNRDIVVATASFNSYLLL